MRSCDDLGAFGHPLRLLFLFSSSAHPARSVGSMVPKILISFGLETSYKLYAFIIRMFAFLALLALLALFAFFVFLFGGGDLNTSFTMLVWY